MNTDYLGSRIHPLRHYPRNKVIDINFALEPNLERQNSEGLLQPFIGGARLTDIVFAFVAWTYENTDPRVGLTAALRTRKSTDYYTRRRRLTSDS